jgi:hypothetical protein
LSGCDRTAKAPDGYLREPALYIAPLTRLQAIQGVHLRAEKDARQFTVAGLEAVEAEEEATDIAGVVTDGDDDSGSESDAGVGLGPNRRADEEAFVYALMLRDGVNEERARGCLANLKRLDALRDADDLLRIERRST